MATGNLCISCVPSQGSRRIETTELEKEERRINLNEIVGGGVEGNDSSKPKDRRHQLIINLTWNKNEAYLTVRRVDTENPILVNKSDISKISNTIRSH